MLTDRRKILSRAWWPAPRQYPLSQSTNNYHPNCGHMISQRKPLRNQRLARGSSKVAPRHLLESVRPKFNLSVRAGDFFNTFRPTLLSVIAYFDRWENVRTVVDWKLSRTLQFVPPTSTRENYSQLTSWKLSWSLLYPQFEITPDTVGQIIEPSKQLLSPSTLNVTHNRYRPVQLPSSTRLNAMVTYYTISCEQQR